MMIRKLLLIEWDRANFIKNKSEVFVLEFYVFSKLKKNLHIFGVLENVPSDAKKTLPKLEVFPFQVFQLCWRMTIHKSPKPEGFRTTSKTWPCTFQMWLSKTFIEFWAKFKTIYFLSINRDGRLSRSRPSNPHDRDRDRDSKPRDSRDRDRNLQDSPATKIPRDNKSRHFGKRIPLSPWIVPLSRDYTVPGFNLTHLSDRFFLLYRL